jgi:hypothetical protein
MIIYILILCKCIEENSNYIWTFYESLEMKCFALLPCTDNTQNIWMENNYRKTGKCESDLRVMIFNSIQDYTEFMIKGLTKKQLNQLGKYLKNNVTQLFENKVKICQNNQFDDYHKQILKSYNKILINLSLDSSIINNENNYEYVFLIYFLTSLCVSLCMVSIATIIIKLI